MESLSTNTSRAYHGKPTPATNPHAVRYRQSQQRKRHPLADATNWVNNQSEISVTESPSPRLPHHSSHHPGGNLQNLEYASPSPSKIEDKRISAVSSEDNNHSNRHSQISTTSTNASGRGRRKTHVGPWRLGKTVGKGASGRVRKARHSYTGQDAAIKIVSKKAAKILKSSSLAAIEHSPHDGRKAIPFGIEREVVIMKMIEHPNIIRLYDIWENRGELYLVLEFVEGGELFNHISIQECLSEAEAVRIFRQIIAALSYCHQFNICHRDLKPENILLDRNMDVKIVDFGMAALQPENKWLETPCGSPHYASPEVIRGQPYRGDKADIWSCGVILFAMLAGSLPFDSVGDNWRDVVHVVLDCDYQIPGHLSPEAQDLIWRILQPDPKKRISIRQMWSHPLIKKYESLDSMDENGQPYIGSPIPLTIHDCGPRLTHRREIDREVLRNLRNLWHRATEEELLQKLLNDEANHEKIVYTKLLRYREEQLENYDGPPIEYSTSDYHHTKSVEATPTKNSSHASLSISQARRPVSQYSLLGETKERNLKVQNPTVNRQASVAETERSQSSYDPFRPSRTHFSKTQPDHARITVLRRESQAHQQQAFETGSKTLARSGRTKRDHDDAEVYSIASSPPSGGDWTSRHLQSAGSNRRISRGNSRVTMSSVHSRTTNHSGMVLKRPAAYKRKVSFNHTRKRSASGHQPRLRVEEKQSDSRTLKERFVTDGGQLERESSSSPPVVLKQESPEVDEIPLVRSKKSPKRIPRDTLVSKLRIEGQNWTEDVRKISTELDKLCDTAFNRVSLSSSTPTAFTPGTGYRDSNRSYQSPATSLSIYEDPASDVGTHSNSNKPNAISTNAYPDRPLPPLPSVFQSEQHNVLSYTQQELQKTRDLLKKRNRASYMEPGYLDDVIAHLDRLMQPSTIRLHDEERRAISTPEPNTRIARKDTFDKIIEKTNVGIRSASEPTEQKSPSPAKRSIRLVEDSSENGFKTISPIKPLTIRKKSDAFTSSTGSPRRQRTTSRPASPTKKSKPRGNEFTSGLGSFLDNSLEPIVEGDDFDPIERNGKDTSKMIAKKRSWFRRNHQLAQKGSRDTEIGPPTLLPHDVQLYSECQAAGPGVGKHDSATSEESRGSKGPVKNGRFFKNIFLMNKSHPKNAKKTSRGTGDYELDDEASLSSNETPSGRYQIFHATAKTGADNGKSLDKAATSRNASLAHRKLTNITATAHDRKQSSHEEAKSATTHQPTRQRHHQNWLARFLGIKPASQVLVFQVSKVRARKEIVSVFREWKMYGMREVLVDREASTITTRVDAKNSLHIPPISIHADLHTVLHRGRRANLSLARFTQQKGAKSSFVRVLDALEKVLAERGCLIEDKKKIEEIKRWTGV